MRSTLAMVALGAFLFGVLLYAASPAPTRSQRFALLVSCGAALLAISVILE